MKKSIAFLLILAAATLFLPSGQKVFSQDREKGKRLYAPNRMIVRLKQQAEADYDRGAVPDFVARARGHRMEPLNHVRRDGEYLVELDESVSVEEAVMRANADPAVEFAEPDYLLYADGVPNDSRFSEQWGLFNDGAFGKSGADISATRAWDITTGSDSVVVAVIDSGTDLQHSDLAPNAWVNPREVAGDNIDNDDNGYVDDISGWDFVNDSPVVFKSLGEDFHGTHCAGIIGAAGNNGFGTAGVAWNVKIMSLKFLAGRSGSSSDAIKAIKYVTDLKKSGVNVNVINASWSGPGGSDSLLSAIEKAGQAGVLFVCAAGNGGDDSRGDDIDAEPVYPAAWAEDHSSIISVTAINRSDEFPGSYNYGHSRVSVGAPGVSVLSTYPGDSYAMLSGTSMATPHVAGIAALLFSSDLQLTPAQVKDRIMRTAEPILPLAGITASAGRANAYYAVTNTIPSVATRPAIRAVRTNKKVVTIEGLGFYQGAVIIEVNGIPVEAGARFDNSYQLAGGSYTQVTAKLGKAGIKSNFPTDREVSVTVYNQATNERSNSFPFKRVP
jgi:serine protease